MQVKRVKCPNCGVLLDVKNTQNETLKELACPRCRAMLKVKFSQQEAPLEAHTVYGPNKQYVMGSGGETQLGGSAASAETQLGSKPNGEDTMLGGNMNDTSRPRLTMNGVDYPLAMGLNIIGRKGVTSQATVQIATDDRYMSRQHCRIALTRLADGMVKAVLSEYKNKNLTAVDGQQIELGDEIRLTDGNSITMGHTTVEFKM